MNLNRLVTALGRLGPREGARAAHLAMLGLLVITGGVGSPASQAAEATISARYRGEASGKFENTTPAANFCGRWPGVCEGVSTVDLPLTFNKIVTWGVPDTLSRYYIRVPGRRTVEVTHQGTGERYQLTFEIASIGASFYLYMPDEGNDSPVARIPQGGCDYQRVYNARLGWHLWAVQNPQSPTGCHVQQDSGFPGQRKHGEVGNMGIVYRLSTPSVLKMKQGLYRGSMHFAIGPMADFDFGHDVSNLSSNSLTVNIELDVQHAFAVDFPPGSERAVLEPPGGWLEWLNGGQPPQRLYRDQPFSLWSSGPLQVYKLCQYDVASHCGIRNQNNDQVPVSVAMTLPAGFETGGTRAGRVEIPTGRQSALLFEPQAPASNSPGQLHFQVGRDAVRGMLEHAGSTYQGQVTVVFDADV